MLNNKLNNLTTWAPGKRCVFLYDKLVTCLRVAQIPVINVPFLLGPGGTGVNKKEKPLKVKAQAPKLIHRQPWLYLPIRHIRVETIIDKRQLK